MDITISYVNIINFIDEISLDKVEHHSESWKNFEKFIIYKGYNKWSQTKPLSSIIINMVTFNIDDDISFNPFHK